MADGKKVGLWVGLGCLILLVVVVLPLVLCVGVCGAGIGGVVVATEGAITETDAFFADLRGGNVDAAYQRTSPNYRATRDQNAFRAAVARFPVLAQQTGITIGGRNLNASGRVTATLNGSLTTPTGGLPIQIVLAREGEVWRIDSVLIQGQPL